MIVCVITAWFFAGAAIISRLLKQEGIDFDIVMFFHTSVGSVGAISVGLLMAATNKTKFMVYDDWRAYMWIVIGGMCDFAAMTSHTIAFGNDKPSFVSIFTFTAVVWSFLADLFIFGADFTTGQILCGLLIFSSTIAVGIYKYRQDMLARAEAK